MKIVFYQDYSQALNNIDIYSSSFKANTKPSTYEFSIILLMDII